MQRYGIDGYICNENWDDVDASVVCREKGYGGGIAVGYKYTSIGPIFLTKFNCKGTESKLTDCDNSDKINRLVCSGSFDYARVICYRSTEGMCLCAYICMHLSVQKRMYVFVNV